MAEIKIYPVFPATIEASDNSDKFCSGGCRYLGGYQKYCSLFGALRQDRKYRPQRHAKCLSAPTKKPKKEVKHD